jgi:hypothetical protein
LPRQRRPGLIASRPNGACGSVPAPSVGRHQAQHGRCARDCGTLVHRVLTSRGLRKKQQRFHSPPCEATDETLPGAWTGHSTRS